MIRMIAAASGFDARVVSQSERFFAEIDAWQPTHLAIDLVMPDMDGVQVLGALARRQCSADIIITSGMGSRVLDAAKLSAREHGLRVVGVLSKPFAAASLRAMLVPVSPAEPQVPSKLPKQASMDAYQVTESDLRAAIDGGHLCVHYQPKILCSDGSLVGFEALVRWNHPEQGMILPDRFVPFAEACGLIDALTYEVLQQSLTWFMTHLTATVGSPLFLSINLSAASLHNREFLERILSCCAESRAPPERLIFEVTETSAMRNPIAALDLLTRMRVQGFQLSIDDFGTGFSSMLQLVRLPFSEVKVDKSFTSSATHSLESRTVVKSIVDLGHSLGLKAAAEGVEDAPTLALLKELGCDFAQGYFIGRPMDAGAAADWIAAPRRRTG